MKDFTVYFFTLYMHMYKSVVDAWMDACMMHAWRDR